MNATSRALFSVHNFEEMREEIEIEIGNSNGAQFTGTITMVEAKHGMYRDCLGFRDFSNFDGVRFAYKGRPLVTFKLKEPINVDTLYENRYFEFTRKSMKKGKLETTVIECKIKGLRPPRSCPSQARVSNVRTDPDGSVKVLIKGCEYRIPEDAIKNALSHWGELTSEIQEERFQDPHDPEGANRTGNYSVQMKMTSPVPEWLPIHGKRIKICYKNVKWLCKICYGPHNKKDCDAEKLTWTEYVDKFAEENPELPGDFYGNYWEKQATKNMQNRSIKPKLVKPGPSDFGVPVSKEDYNVVLIEMMKTGMNYDVATADIKARITEYKKACHEYKSSLPDDQNVS